MTVEKAHKIGNAEFQKYSYNNTSFRKKIIFNFISFFYNLAIKCIKAFQMQTSQKHLKFLDKITTFKLRWNKII